MRFPFHLLRLLAIVAVLALLPSARPARAWKVPVTDFPPGFSLPQSEIVFKTTFLLDELPMDTWTERQGGEIAYFREQMRKRDEIFLLLRISMDAIGRKEENEALADDVAQAVALRLRASGIPADRMMLLPGREEPGPIEGRRLSGFSRFQKVEITGFLGSSWLRRRPSPEVKREVELPRPAEIVLLEPSMETTDRSNHMLRGKTESSIRVVSVTIGEEARTVTVRDGVFEAPISLRAGENPIVVTGLDPFGRAVRTARAIRYIPPRPTIEILSPAAGAVTDITRSPVVIVRGSIRSETPLQEAFLIQNDIPRNIRVRGDGSFEQPAILMTEEDTFQVEALDTAGQVGISGIRPAPAHGVPDRPLMAILHWDEDDVDLDLHVTDGSGNHTWFDAADPLDAPGAIPEGKLWIDNRKGYGPEVFSIERDAPGEYTLSAEYYRGKKPCRAFLTLVLFAGTPSRKLVRIYGPVTLSPREPAAPILRVSLPSGIVRELTGATPERVQR
ncbi:MAG: hypothetical protein WC899_04285 [bacterium]|jgi:hypothetical protein